MAVALYTAVSGSTSVGVPGAMLWAVAAKDGSRISEIKHDALPVWDGMVAARGRLYLSTIDGRLTCFGE